METHTNHSSSRTLAQLLLAAMTAFMLVLAIAPGADAQSRDTKSSDGDLLAATEGCPDGFVEGRFGCVPENFTSEREPEYVVVEFDNGCPDGWVPSSAGPGPCQPGNETVEEAPDYVVLDLGCPDKWVPSSAGPGPCQPGFFTIDLGGVEFDDGCQDNWVPSSAPGGCSPGYLTLKLAGLEFDNGCPDNWVPSSAPGGCSPGFITIDTGRQVFEAQHHCAFGAACDDMIEAIKALGGECSESVYGDTCTLPTGPQGRD